MTLDFDATFDDATALRARFGPILAEIRDTGVAHDVRRELPYALVRRLADLGFGGLRVPKEFGGSGVSFPVLVELVLDLAAADSNFAQLLRSHFIYTELLIHSRPSSARSEWLRRIAAGDLFGGAHTEQNTENQTHFSTRIETTRDGRRIITGDKYYSTGSLYADWIIATGEGEDDSVVHVVVAPGAEGVELVDDWDGFGQKLTASGTTRFERVDFTDTPQLPPNVELGGYGTSVAQLWHLAALAGIARAVHDEVVEYVRGRRRWFSQGTRTLPRDDVLVHEVVGQVSAARHVAETLVRHSARTLGSLGEKITAGAATREDHDFAEIEIYRAQVSVIDVVLSAVTRVFDVGGASALSSAKGWDRYWRNARTLSSHNPTPYRLAGIGAYDLNGTSPFRSWLSGVDLRDRK